MSKVTMEKEVVTTVEAAKMQDNNLINITTNLMNREEAFRMVALAEATGLPLLLLGPPGVGKTNVVRDYATARIHGDLKLFMIEVDDSTRPQEVKGRPDMKALTIDHEYKIVSPVVDADYIIINEIDKAAGTFRHALMSIMNEKVLFNGQEEISLKYKAFIGTANLIPKDEKDSPMWDRFVFKYNVSRMTQEQIMGYLAAGHKNHRESFSMTLPTAEHFTKASGIHTVKLDKLINILYSSSSDRTLSHVPNIVKAVQVIWGSTMDNTLIKTCEILGGPEKAKQLADQITSKKMKAIMDKIDMLNGLSDDNAIKTAVNEIYVQAKNYRKSDDIDENQMQEVEEAVNHILKEKGVDVENLMKTISKK